MLAATGRWIYRHRSALAPFTTALAALITAAILHIHHARWWIPVTVMTVTVAVLLGFPYPVLARCRAGAHLAHGLSRMWAAAGIDRATERAYAAVVVTVTGGWLAAATALGPIKPLPQIGGIGTVILGVPWWYHRRRREKVRVERITREQWPVLAEHIGLPSVHITSAVVDVWGWTARAILKKGTTAHQVTSKIPDIESGLGLRPGSVRVTPDPDRANRLTLRVVEKDPHAQPVPWPGPAITSVTQPIPIGVSEDGQTVTVRMLRRNVLIGGIMGAGKSGILNILIAALAACPDVILWGVDLKGGMELQPWADCFAKLATSPAGATALFREAAAWLDDRAARMAAEGQRVREPTPADPALVVITDEYAELPGLAHQHADSVARRGRAVAVNLIAATQRPTQDAMGKTAVRSQMDVRICLRVRERRDVDLILGQGSFAAGWHAHQLTQPGAFLLSDPEHPHPARHRAYLITDPQIERHATACATHRPTPPQPAAGRWPPTPPRWPQDPGPAPSRGHDHDDPDAALWAALRDAGPGGVPTADLVTVTGMTRATLHRRLRALAAAGRATQTGRGHWRATTDEGEQGRRARPGQPPGRDHQLPPDITGSD
ncbi:MAG TPA: FtsK/SpoIIIE domain-containing protein [Streptosporangiaceae bacterium]|nr:FtsK/SpoIIIE domain-containing protein [Streptosporangiaceae bacterium]